MSRTYVKVVQCGLERSRERNSPGLVTLQGMGMWVHYAMQWCIFYTTLHCMTQCPQYVHFYFLVCVEVTG